MTLPYVKPENPALPIDALIFDMDGLLVDSEPASESAMRQFLAGHGHELRPESVEKALGKRLAEAIEAIAETYVLPGTVEELIAAFDDLRLESLRGSVLAMPGAMELLDWAAERSLLCALATSSSRRQADVALAEAGLVGRFGAEATGDEVHAGKPHPELFLLAAMRLDVHPAACLVFEDAPAGVEAAAAAGMRCVWVPNALTRGLSPQAPFAACLESLLEAPAWLERNGVGRASPSSAESSTGTIEAEKADAQGLA